MDDYSIWMIIVNNLESINTIESNEGYTIYDLAIQSGQAFQGIAAGLAWEVLLFQRCFLVVEFKSVEVRHWVSQPMALVRREQFFDHRFLGAISWTCEVCLKEDENEAAGTATKKKKKKKKARISTKQSLELALTHMDVSM